MAKNGNGWLKYTALTAIVIFLVVSLWAASQQWAKADTACEQTVENRRLIDANSQAIAEQKIHLTYIRQGIDEIKAELKK